MSRYSHREVESGGSCRQSAALTNSQRIRDRVNSAVVPQAFSHYFYDALVDFLNTQIAIDDHHAQRLTGRDLAIFVKDAPIEKLILAFKPVFVRRVSGSSCVTPAGALQRSVKIREQ